MDYHEAANVLLGLRRYPSGEGIESTADLLAHLGDPHDGLTCVQVAGSNGKGTTARMVERTLREAGLSVGLYTSPHFDDVRERIRVDGTPVREAAVADFVAAVADHVTDRGAAGESPTFFETLTALALWEFDRQDVDVAVLEVGIGGRYDATSVVDPVASAVTSVALEHTEVLGDTVFEIARDKAQVAPESGPLVTATEGEALRTVEAEVDDVVTVGDRGATDRDVVVTYGGRRGHAEAAVEIAGEDWRVETAVPVLGAHQARNAGVAAALARATAEAVGVDLPVSTVERGLRGAHWPGRFEVLGADPLVVLDGAHNPGACATLSATLSEFEYDDLHLVFGALVDKDHAGMVEALPEVASVVTASPDLDRAEAPATLARAFETAGVEAGTVGSVAAALSDALARAGPEDCVLATGSLHTVAEARRRWTRTGVEREVRSVSEGEAVLRGADVASGDVERTAEATDHRVLTTRLRPRQATHLKAELLAVGGACAVSAVEDDRELRSVVASGTVAQFRRVTASLREAPHGLAEVAADLRRRLGIESSAATDPPAVECGVGFAWLDDTAVMGILNVTPDSFHDGGEYDAVAAAVDRAREMVAAGVDVIDVGGESTRPGADPVSPAEERDRVVPVIEAIREAGIEEPVSVDTRKASVADAALAAGADLINDVSGLEDPEMRFVAADHDAGLVVMHSVETPVDPDSDPEYDDVVADVLASLRERVLLAERAGVPREKIVVDPGVGFGKSAAESFELLDRIGEFDALDCPVLVGHSHKSMFDLVGADHGERLAPTVATTALAADRGADLIRVHDPAENVAAVRSALAMRDPGRFADSE
jgi:dihydropteroate synthase